MKQESALVVFSGGQDSTTCLFWAKQRFKKVVAIAFDYGQRHRIELEAAQKIATIADVPLSVFHLGTISEITSNALTTHTLEVEESKPDQRPPNTLVEGRNMLFLTYAAVFAKEKNIRNIVTGVGQADYSGYPDCRNDFITSLNKTLNLSMDYDYQIHTPLMWKNKTEIWELADDLGVFDLVKNETVTCYNGIKGSGCGNCPSCNLRNRGLTNYINKKNNGQTKTAGK